MADTRLMPIVGMDNVSEDAALHRQGEGAFLHVRDAVNVDITPAGKLNTRGGTELVSGVAYKNIWQSSLHGDVFATLGDDWGLLDVSQEPWHFEPLAEVGRGRVQHLVLNNLIAVCGSAGIYTYDGSRARKLNIATPATPLVIAQDEGALAKGTYGFAVSFLVGDKESGLSEMASVDIEGGAQVVMPLILDSEVTRVRVYATKQNSGELLRLGDYPAGTPLVDVTLLDKLGEPARFRYLSPMPSGKHFAYWRGRLVSADANIVRFSEPLTYHLHNERHGFVQMPQRVTFVEAVDGGLWIGQVDHVAFLEGSTLDVLSLHRKTSKAPVPFSSIQIGAEDLGAELSQGGMASAMWLAENGLVVGTATGQIYELHGKKIKGISGKSGATVRLDGRITATIT